MANKLKFTDQWIKTLKGDERVEQHFGDLTCKGLSLKLTKLGVKSFSYTFRLGAKTGRITLGHYPDVSLKEARDKVEELRRLVAAGIDPRQVKAEKKQRQRNTVEEMAGQFIEKYSKVKNKSWRQAESNLRLHLLPSLGAHPVASVRRRDIHDILDRLIAEGKGTTANRALAHIKKFFGWLVERDHLEHSPADHIKKPFSERPRERALSDNEISAIWSASQALSGPSRAWVMLSLLCGQRETETASIRRSQIEGANWLLATTDTKNKRQSVIPLSRQAEALVDELMKGEGEYLLSTGRVGDHPINGFSKLKAQLDQLSGVKEWRLHDLRAAVATNLGKLGYDRFLIKRVLNHTDKDVTAIYDRYSYLEEKREALQKWADRLDDIVTG